MKNDIANNRIRYREDWEALINEYGPAANMELMLKMQQLWRGGQVREIIELQLLLIKECNYDTENV